MYMSTDGGLQLIRFSVCHHQVGESAPEKKQEHTFEKAGSPISLMKMGIGRNSFLLAGPDVSVLRNMDGKVEASGTRFNIDSSQGGQLTPMKVVLAKV